MSVQREGLGHVVIRTDDPCLVRHDSKENAVAEAKRLAECTGGTFVVLSPVAMVTPVPRSLTFDLKEQAAPLTNEQVRQELARIGDNVRSALGL